jgi:chitinase
MRDLFKRAAAVFLVVILTAGLLTYAAAKKPVDRQPPTAPQNLTATAVGQTSVSLKWTASTDNKGIASYLIYKNSVQIGTTTGTSYNVTGLTEGTAYSFFVKAKDWSANVSQPSNTLTVTTSTLPAPDPSPSPSPEPSPSPSPSPELTKKIVSGYYASWSAYSGYTPQNIQADKLTAVNYAFAKIGDDLKIALGDPYIDLTNFTQLSALKKTYPSLKTLISIGGWNDSGKFSDAALTDASQTAFADSVVAFVKQYGFNGADIDWEYPVGGGLSTNIKRSADKTNFTLLLQKLREKLDAQGSIDGQKYLLTIAGGAGSFYVTNTELSKIAGYVDYATIMTYDMHGTWDGYTDLNAPLYAPSEASPQYKWSVDQSVKAWTGAGFPASKIVLGMPFYGYIYTNVTGGGNGLYKTFSGGGSVSYDKVLSTYLSNSAYIRYVHSGALVPWLFNGSTFISYDDEASIGKKASYIVTNNLAGASVWELSQNKGGQLLGALVTNLK